MDVQESIPVFYSDSFEELAALIIERVPTDRSGLVYEPSSVDELPGRRILVNGEPLCRVVPDPFDPRPLPGLINKLIDAMAAKPAP
jgi:hypothetical protein